MPNPVGRFPVVAAAAKAKEITSIMFLHSNKNIINIIHDYLLDFIYFFVSL